MFTELISRKDAIEQGLKHYFTGKPCKYGHTAKRQVSCKGCIECKYAKRKEYYQENKEQENADNRLRHKERYESNPEYYLEKNKEWIKNNPEKWKKSKETWAQANRDKVNKFSREWKSKNKDYVVAETARRRANREKRTPCWLTKEQDELIRSMYKLAVEKTKQTGVVWHVDHIIPLNGKNVSGFHVPENLRVIPASENMRKSNNFNLTV